VRRRILLQLLRVSCLPQGDFGVALLEGDPYANVWGVGEGVSVADLSTEDKLGFGTGSSYVAPQVSGLIAMYLEDPKLETFWSESQSKQRASLKLLREKSELRRVLLPFSNRKPLIYNLAHEQACPPASQPRPRDVAGGSRCIDPKSGAYSTLPAPVAPPLPVITSGSGDGECKVDKRVGPVGIDSKPIDKNALQKCLLNFDAENWHDAKAGKAVDCGGMVSFQSNNVAWKTPADCHNACKNCLSKSIEEGVNQIWCDARSGSAHCWEGYVITPPALVTDGTYYDSGSQVQKIVASGYTGMNGKYLDQYAVQDCIRHMPANDWLVGDKVYDCRGIVHFDMYSVSWPSGWSSPPDCWNAIKNCLSDAVNAGASEAFCEAVSGFAQCRGGFFPR
jgi:hypothetical protein